MTMGLTTNWGVATTDYYYEYDYSVADSAEYLLSSVVHFILSVLILFGNTLTILAFCRFPELRTQTNVFVLNLAIADNLVGVSASLIGFTFLDFAASAFHGSAYLCVFLYTLATVSCCQSLLTLLMMAVDRLMYVVYPYQHLRFFTQRRIVVGMGIAWLLSIASGTLIMVHHRFNPEKGCDSYEVMPKNVERVMFPIAILLDLILTSACYVKIACVAHEQKKAISANTNIAQHLQKQEGLSHEIQSSERHKRKANAELKSSATQIVQPKQHARSRGAKSIGLFVTVNCLFSVCWIPWAVRTLLLEHVPYTEDFFLQWFFFLALSNSAMNALILACKDKQFARAYRSLLTRRSCCCCRNAAN